MKKILSIFTVLIFFVSIIASVSPEIKAQMKDISGGNTYAVNIIPLPVLDNESYADNKPVGKNYAALKSDKKSTVVVNDLQFIE